MEKVKSAKETGHAKDSEAVDGPGHSPGRNSPDSMLRGGRPHEA